MGRGTCIQTYINTDTSIPWIDPALGPGRLKITCWKKLLVKKLCFCEKKNVWWKKFFLISFSEKKVLGEKRLVHKFILCKKFLSAKVFWWIKFFVKDKKNCQKSFFVKHFLLLKKVFKVKKKCFLKKYLGEKKFFFVQKEKI